MPKGQGLTPYGYSSYAEYDAAIDKCISIYGIEAGEENSLGRMLRNYREHVHRMNVKENWSVMKYLGETTSNCLGLTKGRHYYWPCSVENPEYEGVIDDEEFTSYLYATAPKLWEITEDPLNMASSVLLGKSKSAVTIEQMKTISQQLKSFEGN